MSWHGLTRLSAQLLIYVCLINVICTSQQEQQPSSTNGNCSVGPSGSVESLTSLSAQQLAEGRLASSISWDFGVPLGSIKAASGRDVTLSCIVALNVSVSRPTRSSVFIQPMAIDFTNVTGLKMEHVLLRTNCSSVLEYQTYFCSSYSVAGSIMLWHGAVHFTTWSDGFTTLRNVTLTCDSSEAAPQPPCWLMAVQDEEQLLDAFVSYADIASGNFTIVVAANISISNSSWPELPVRVANNVQLVGSSGLYRPVLDFQLLVSMWEVLPTITVSIINMTCVNLAPTYISPSFPASLFALMAHRLWPFRRTDRQLNIINVTLVVSPDELQYMKYWLKFLFSPVPEDRDKVTWMNLTQLKVSTVNDSGVYYESAMSYTAIYQNVLLTDSMGGTYPLLPVNSGLQQILAEDVPLSAVRQVMNVSDMLIALSPNVMHPDSNGRRWLLIIANFSLSDGNRTATNAGATVPIQLPGSMVVGVGASLWPVRLDFGRLQNVLGVAAGSALLLQSLILGDMPSRSAAYDPQAPLEVLVSPLWGLSLEDGASEVTLENCTVLVSAAELQLLLSSLLPPGAAVQAAATAQAFDKTLTAAVRKFFIASTVASYHSSYLRLDSGTTQRYSFTDITFRTPVVADGEGGIPDVVAPGPGGDSSRLERWKIGVIVGCVVGGAVAFAAAASLLLILRRRRAARGQGAYEKYLRSGGVGICHGAPGNAGGGGGSLDLVHASHELTNSSQVLQPDARRSDLEVARLKATGSGTTSASASGGIGAPGRSASITGVTSQDASSGAVLPSGVGGSSASGGGPGGSGGGPGTIAAGSGASGSLQLPAMPSPNGGNGVVVAIAAEGNGSNQTTDSFERPPSNTVLGQHGPAGRQVQRLISLAESSSVPSSIANQSKNLLATGGTSALEQMHLMIQTLGREFNDRQLEVHGLLGRGAHGTVYRGTWRGLPVAVKSMVFSNDSSTRQQSRVLMEAAISANLAHPNIVTTYSYELREVEHELASISPELARQGGGWRLLIIQEYCDAGPLRRLIDCGFFLTPPKPSSVRTKIKLPHPVGLMRKDSPPGEGSTGSATRVDAATAAAAASSSRGSSGSSGGPNGNGCSRSSTGKEVEMAPAAAAMSRPGPGGGTPGLAGPSTSPQQVGQKQQPQQQRPSLDTVPSDVPGRPTSSLQAARRYVEAALMIARGLQHIHDKNIVHGDLNPNNVLLMRAPGTPLEFCLKVADFGLSVRMSEGESHMSNLFQGSPYYCAPEVVLSGKVGKSADIYSFGIMLWELQNGIRPLWRMGVRLRSYPSLNTAELDFGSEIPPRYVRLARDCFHGSKDARPSISVVVETLVGIKAELDAL
ncbi:hypothetical protein Vretimale_3701 [Volvox reticuliferus]|uniref:Protein kinase domain-containing protein n=1 Tax=Volvox reticuliferus TaxID=1737510 RepID=A0A8J4G4U5_9CHLO|nr:hypothetical protein Vretifemale_1309 [Volvox reticuliferus]GIL98299.1 hypothetical protein Vretimale_3701 [Volvox reticuliferus]